MRRITGDASPWLCWTSSPNESLAEPLRRTAGGSKHTECDSPGVRRWLGTLLRRHVYGTVRFEPAFRFLYHHAIAGLFMVGETFEGTGEAAVLDSLRSALPPEPIIVDVGANWGAYARVVLERFPSVSLHCFEPVPGTFAVLNEALGDDPRVHLHPFGLSNESRRTLMRTSRAGPSSTTFTCFSVSDSSSFAKYATASCHSGRTPRRSRSLWRRTTWRCGGRRPAGPQPPHRAHLWSSAKPVLVTGADSSSDWNCSAAAS